MFCSNCGTENKDGSKFCKACGSKLDTIVTPVENVAPAEVTPVEAAPVEVAPVEVASVEAAPVEVQPVAAPVQKAPAPLKPFPTKLVAGIIGGCVASIVAFIAIICLVSNMQKTINLNNYVVLQPTGFEGYGRVNATIDWDAIREKYGKKVKFKGGAETYATMFGLNTPLDIMSMYVSVDVQENQNLVNGQSVTYTFSIDEAALENFSCKLKYKDGTYKVDGLTKVGTFDAFADLEVEFSGIAPDGRVNLNYIGTEIDYYDFSCDKYDGLRNGDVEKVTINENNLESYAQRLGKIPAVMEKEYTVTGLSSYIAKISEVPQDTLAAMDQQAIDTYKAHMANSWADSTSLISFNYLGEYLLTAKSADRSTTQNQLFLVYKVQARNVFETFDKVTDVYWYIQYNDLQVKDDGTMEIDITNYQTPGNNFKVDSGLSNGWWSTMSWNYVGYPSLDELYKNVVTSNLESFNHEDHVQDNGTTQVFTEEMNQQSNGSEYVLANSNTQLLNKEDLNGLTAEQCKIARNEIYARHGRKFTDEALQAHFNSCSWYTGTIEPDNFNDNLLSEIEIANRDLIVEFEKEKGYR